MAEADEHGVAHARSARSGPFQLTMLGIGAVIGAGIFVLSGLGAQTAGPGADARLRALAASAAPSPASATRSSPP